MNLFKTYNVHNLLFLFNISFRLGLK